MNSSENLNTIVEMAQARKYTERHDVDLSSIHPDAVKVFSDENASPIIVFRSIQNMGVSVVKEYILHSSSYEKCNHIIIVYEGSVTPIALKLVGSVHNTHIEIFHESELRFNICKHVLVPKHELCPEHELAAVSKHKHNLPKILTSDPVAKFMGFKRDSIVKITRKDGSVTFRYVI